MNESYMNVTRLEPGRYKVEVKGRTFHVERNDGQLGGYVAKGWWYVTDHDRYESEARTLADAKHDIAWTVKQ